MNLILNPKSSSLSTISADFFARSSKTWLWASQSSPRPAARFQEPPRRTFVTNNGARGPPAIRPPKGIADKLNQARLKDFMSLGAFLLRNRRLQ
ncbi:hypothetical protein M3Y98_00264000 [Aphelenchoides besseyi]|nr:hypothetical protein M3Y98_00264000 [Aphelenchoides besseyi]KAI6200890.1 hypothetical protein M3Y96_00782500 [Aphelenchoides besseyi]